MNIPTGAVWFRPRRNSFDENSGEVVIGWPLRSPIPFVPMIIWVHPIVIRYVPIKPVSASKTVGEKTTLSFSAKEPGFEELFKNPKIRNTKYLSTIRSPCNKLGNWDLGSFPTTKKEDIFRISFEDPQLFIFALFQWPKIWHQDTVEDIPPTQPTKPPPCRPKFHRSTHRRSWVQGEDDNVKFRNRDLKMARFPWNN